MSFVDIAVSLGVVAFVIGILWVRHTENTRARLAREVGYAEGYGAGVTAERERQARLREVTFKINCDSSQAERALDGLEARLTMIQKQLADPSIRAALEANH